MGIFGFPTKELLGSKCFAEGKCSCLDLTPHLACLKGTIAETDGVANQPKNCTGIIGFLCQLTPGKVVRIEDYTGGTLKIIQGKSLKITQEAGELFLQAETEKGEVVKSSLPIGQLWVKSLDKWTGVIGIHKRVNWLITH